MLPETLAINYTEAQSQAAVGAVSAAASVAAIPYVGWSMVPEVFASTLALLSGGASLAAAAGGWDEVPSDQLAMVHKSEMILPAHLAKAIRDMANPAATIAQAANLAMSTALPSAGPLGSASTILRSGLAASLAPALSIAANGPARVLSGIGSYGIPADKLTFTRAVLGGGLSFGSQGAGSAAAAKRGSGGDMHIHIPITALDSKGVAGVLDRSSSDVNKLIKDWARRGKLSGIPKRYRGR